MTHPVHEARAHEEKRAHEYMRRCGGGKMARGGKVHSDEREDRELVDRMVKKDALTGKRSGGKVAGHHPKHRADKRARGGRMQHRDDGGEVNAQADNQLNSQYGKMSEDYNLSLGNSQKRGGPVKRARGGRMDEDYPEERARGGRTGKSKGAVNIVIATGGGEPERQMAFQQGTKVGTAMGTAARPPMMPPQRPPMPPPGGMPPGAMGGAPPPGMAGSPPGGMPMRPPMRRGGRMKMAEDEPQERKHGGRAYPIHDGAGGGEARLEKMHNYERGGHIRVKEHVRRRAGGAV